MKRGHSPGKSLPSRSPAALREKGGFSAMTTFSLQTSCLCQSNHQLCRMVCTPSVSHQCLGDPSKLALKVNIFFAHQVYLLWPRINLLRMVGRQSSLRSWKGLKCFENRLQNQKMVSIIKILVLPSFLFSLVIAVQICSCPFANKFSCLTLLLGSAHLLPFTQHVA